MDLNDKVNMEIDRQTHKDTDRQIDNQLHRQSGNGTNEESIEDRPKKDNVKYRSKTVKKKYSFICLYNLYIIYYHFWLRKEILLF